MTLGTPRYWHRAEGWGAGEDQGHTCPGRGQARATLFLGPQCEAGVALLGLGGPRVSFRVAGPLLLVSTCPGEAHPIDCSSVSYWTCYYVHLRSVFQEARASQAELGPTPLPYLQVN